MSSFSVPDQNYFLVLAGYSRDFVARLGLSNEAQSLDRLLGELKPRLEGMRDAEAAVIGSIPRPMSTRVPDGSRATSECGSDGA